jgi:hypothetical protein
MRSVRLTHTSSSFLGALVSLLLPSAAYSLQLFEGNWGYHGTWIQVVDSPAIDDRIYWYALGDDVSYQVQASADAGFAAENLLLDESGILANHIAPNLGPGGYFFRVREVHASGVAGDWSNTGTLDVFEDVAAPEATILSPLEGQHFSPGDSITIEVEVSDDTVLHLARFSIGGEYSGTLGIKTEGDKLAPSFDEPRTVAYATQIPATGKTGPVEISVTVSDVMHRSVTRTVTIDTGSGSGSTAKAKGRNKSK